MESAISDFCKSLAAFCHHVDSTSKALSDSIQRRPIPLDSAASAFLHSLDRRVSSAGADLNLLESMAFGTVSFEELLGHCNEVYKRNAAYLAALEDRMTSFGYVPGELELEDENDEVFGDDGLESTPLGCGSTSKRLEEDDLFDDDSVSLQNLGLSDACLATLASSEGNNHPMSPTISSRNAKRSDDVQLQGKDVFQPQIFVLDASAVGVASRNVIQISRGDYDNLPSYMKSLASWEELEEAVVKMNHYLSMKNGVFGSGALNQDDLETLGLGRKGRSYFLLLLRMNQLVVETVDGSIFYRVCVDCS